MTNINDFSINVPEEKLEDLKKRLELTRWPDKETPPDWTQGIPLSYMKEIHSYWLNDYDWNKEVARINEFPQFTAKINDLDIHFIHMKSPHSEAKPLIITHGWPGSIVEFLQVIKPLADPTLNGGDPKDAFHIVTPSLPGFGFSGKPTTPGFGVEKIADTFAELMKELGYTKYFAQGGDWGSAVTTALGMQDENCEAIHLNMAIVAPDMETMNDLTELEQSALAGFQFYQDWDSGYSKQQSTRPQTLGYGLTDSPIGQAAWIIEKFYQWTDCNGDPENAISRDDLLTNVMFYWLTESATSSARLYWESFGDFDGEEVTTPTGVSVYPKEIFRASERWLKKRYTKLSYYNVLDSGGHFAAFEKQFSDSISDTPFGRFLQESGLSKKRINNLVFTLALQSAALNNQKGRDISDKDIERFLNRAGANATSEREFRLLLNDLAIDAIDYGSTIIKSQFDNDVVLGENPEGNKVGVIATAFPNKREGYLNQTAFVGTDETLGEYRQRLINSGQYGLSLNTGAVKNQQDTTPRVISEVGKKQSGYGTATIDEIARRFNNLFNKDQKRGLGYLSKIRKELGADSLEYKELQQYIKDGN
mgnify:CR=1 FL=1